MEIPATTSVALTSFGRLGGAKSAPYQEQVRDFIDTELSRNKGATLRSVTNLGELVKYSVLVNGLIPEMSASRSDMDRLDYATAIAAYQDASKHGTLGERDKIRAWTQQVSVVSDAGRDYSWNVREKEQALVTDYNRAATPFLKQYAEQHWSDWTEAAELMQLPVTGANYLPSFSSLPRDTGHRLGTQDAKSVAEHIFRSVASPNEVAAFEQRMQPQQAALDKQVAAFGDNLAAASARLQDRREQATALTGALAGLGINNGDLAKMRWSQAEDGRIAVWTSHPRKADIEALVNADPQLVQTFHDVWSHPGAPVSCLA